MKVKAGRWLSLSKKSRLVLLQVVCAQIRAMRQLAGDISRECSKKSEEQKQWEDIEWELNNLECKLEKMNLK